jgi:hypothetical protein
MAGPRGETCAGCYFWAADGAPADAAEGECRFYAPRPTYGNLDMSPDWAVTYDYEWCGQWLPRDQGG